VSKSEQARRADKAPEAGKATEAGQAEPAPPATPHSETAARRPHIRSGQRSYLVRPGDSLWSIAVALRGSHASVAAVTREVRRLWALNRDRIGTGDPDLLPTGVRLRLRR
jgi:nucleoid-associated protein YgaU